MFETTDDVLRLLGIFSAVGFGLGVVYNIVRFFRLSFPGLRVTAAVLDILFSLISGLILFIFSTEYGMGFFRLYYVAAAAFGFAVNMLTLGWLISPLARLFGRVCSFFVRILTRPVVLFCQKTKAVFIKIREKSTKLIEKCKKHLSIRHNKLYNKNNSKIEEVYKESGEKHNAVKAKVRKAG